MHLGPMEVSILTQLIGWTQFGLIRFNPHPTYRLGEATGNKQRMVLSRFNPHLNLSAGCSIIGALLGRADAIFQSSPNLSAECWCVSILTELMERLSILA